MSKNKTSDSREDQTDRATDSKSQKIPKMLDIFQHLKENIRNMDTNCHCNNEYNQIYYCILCKASVCPKCEMSKHYTHVLIQKAQYELSPEKVDSIYSDLQSIFAANAPFKEINESRELLISQVNKMTLTLMDKITQLETEKVNEINTLFDSITVAYNSMQKAIETTKSTLKNYLINNREFFSTSSSKEQGSNCDASNTIFLLNYDFINLSYMKKCQLNKLEKSIVKDYQQYQLNLDVFIKETIRKSDQAFFDILMTDKAEIEAVKNEVQVSQSEELYEKHRMNYPQLNLYYSLNKLSKETFDELNSRLSVYSKQIQIIKRTIFATLHKTKGLKDIEGLLNLYEARKTNKIDKLFSQRKMQLKDKTKTSTTSLGMKNRTEGGLKAKEDVRLDYDPVIQKYFAYLFLDLYGNNFRIESKEFQSSHVDLLIKPPEEEIDPNTMKIIEESNEIIYYDRTNCVMVKEEVPLRKNPFGYIKFPTGCRQLSMGDKLYITGGTDELQTYPNVLVYDSSRKLLKRLMDMNYPRAYHSLVFNDIFSTLMVIGGEHCDSVEIFDPENNRWRLLPELNYPRSNISFYFDHLKGFFYAMFGIEGDFVNEQFTDVVEILDLTQIKDGWKVIELKNPEEIFLKTHVMITPVSNEKILIYGSKKKRGVDRIACMLDVTKNEIIKIDQKVIEELRIKAMTSKSLSRILSQISINSGMSQTSLSKKSEK